MISLDCIIDIIYNKLHTKAIHYKKANIKIYTNHYDIILNFVDKRLTNTNAESFNAKIKILRVCFRGVVDVKFFLFRVAKLFA